MSPQLEDSVVRLLAQARAGSVEALGTLFERYRPYLLMIANAELAEELRAKVAPSDLVQQTWLKVQNGFPQFAGATADGWKAWLGTILRTTLANCARDYQAALRDVRRETHLQNDDSAEQQAFELAAPGPSPSSIILARERDELLGRALEGLPEHYREVVRLHNLEGVSFEEIAQRQGKSLSAVRQLWGRALGMLADILEDPHEPPAP